MADINRDLDRYLSKRKGSSTFAFKFDASKDSNDGWALFGSKEELPEEELSPDEKEKLESMEEDIKAGEEKLEEVHEIEEQLEEEQEKKVGLYHQLLGLFRRKHAKEDEFVESEEVTVYENDEVTEDFRRLAQIQIKWLELLPNRHKNAFRESDDYQEFTEILERRGVARRK